LHVLQFAAPFLTPRPENCRENFLPIVNLIGLTGHWMPAGAGTRANANYLKSRQFLEENLLVR
jgi:hypothetical protein